MTGFVTTEQAAELLGVSSATLRRRAAAGDLQRYEFAHDRKRRMIALEDVRRLMIPQPREERPPRSAA